MEPSPGNAGAVDADRDEFVADLDPNERVHHHAHTEQVKPGSILTLCGLVLAHGARPEAASMPCCPMCAAEMEALGQRCRNA